MPIDPFSAIADQIVQSVAKVVWERPELTPLRERIQNLLKTRQFRVLTIQAFEQFDRHVSEQFPDYFDSGFIRMPRVQALLAEHIVDDVPVDFVTLVELYGKRHLFLSDSEDVQALLAGYLHELYAVFYGHPEYGPRTVKTH